MAKKEAANKIKGAAKAKPKAKPKVKASAPKAKSQAKKAKPKAASKAATKVKTPPARKSSKSSPIDVSACEFTTEQIEAFNNLSRLQQEIALARIGNPSGTYEDWYAECPAGKAKKPETIHATVSEILRNPKFVRFWEVYSIPKAESQLERAQREQDSIIEMFQMGMDAAKREIRVARLEDREASASLVNAGRACATDYGKMRGYVVEKRDHTFEDLTAQREKERKQHTSAFEKMSPEKRKILLDAARDLHQEIDDDAT